MKFKENLFNFIMTLYIGFFIIYLSAPTPKILYKKILGSKIKNNSILGGGSCSNID
jgi:hypothetical protein